MDPPQDLHLARETSFNEFNKIDPHLSFLDKPHTLTALLLSGILIISVGFTRQESSSPIDTAANVKLGLVIVALVFLLFAALQFRDGLFVRPHPIVWRLVMGCAVLYLCILVFLFFQTKDDIRRWILPQLDAKLGRPLPERSYAEHCELYTPGHPSGSNFAHLMETINDEFIAAHFVGWFGKVLILRDVWLCHILSVLFELVELSLEHQLPNFKECAFDHILLDIIICNGLGIHLGMFVLRRLQMKEYHFLTNRLRPRLSEFHWEVLTSFKHLMAVVFMLSIMIVVELNAFYLKALFWIPPPHPLVILRLILWWGIGLPGVREFYQYVVDQNTKKLGTSAWLCLANCAMEVLISLKFGQGEFPNPAPFEVVAAWGLAAAIFCGGALWFFKLRHSFSGKTKTS